MRPLSNPSLRGVLATKQSRGLVRPWVAAPLVAARDDVIHNIPMGLVSDASGALNFLPA
ncbi:hypothetical protein MNBD_NITROSPINAE05-84 [hydrothermal vent metagenome]|uniref:Uncharacterized protein n=1 Tax=hydrothermal vent metagenome TaxID=652676 RepID=A0A3B1D389_9ZZZZ